MRGTRTLLLPRPSRRSSTRLERHSHTQSSKRIFVVPREGPNQWGRFWGRSRDLSHYVFWLGTIYTKYMTLPLSTMTRDIAFEICVIVIIYYSRYAWHCKDLMVWSRISVLFWMSMNFGDEPKFRISSRNLLKTYYT